VGLADGLFSRSESKLLMKHCGYSGDRTAMTLRRKHSIERGTLLKMSRKTTEVKERRKVRLPSNFDDEGGGDRTRRNHLLAQKVEAGFTSRELLGKEGRKGSMDERKEDGSAHFGRKAEQE